MKKRVHRNRRILILCIICLMFVSAVVTVFGAFQYHISEKIHDVLCSGLESNVQDQKVYAQMLISDVHRLLDMLDTKESKISQEDWELVIQDRSIHMDYLNREQVQALCPATEDCQYLERLLTGNDVVTQVGDPLFAENLTSFALLHPLCDRSGRLKGVLRARVDAGLLVDGSMDAVSMSQKKYTVLTDADGNVVYADTPYPDGGNLFSAAVQRGIGSREMQSVQQLFRENPSKSICFQGKGNDYYMAWESLGFNDWRIVRFVRSPDVILQTKSILRGMVLSGTCLIALTVVFCLALINLLLRQKRRLEAQKRRYDSLAQFNDTLLFEFDVTRNQVIFTPNALERLDLDPQCLKGISSEYCLQHLLHPDDRGSVGCTLQPANMLLGETRYLEARFRSRDGAYNWFGCQFKSIEDGPGGTKLLVGKLVDISDQRGRELVLRQAALVDSLTGIYNRSVETIINEQLERDQCGLFFMIDLDNFKNVNDTYGHAAGDALLVNMADILRKVFRSEDLIGRVGGDEFVAFVSGTNDPGVAERKGLAIQNHMEHLYIPGSTQTVSASIGAAIAPRDGTSYGELTRAADQAMYSIKKKSKKGFAVHPEKEEM